MQSDEGYMSEDYLDKAQVHNYAQNSTHDQDWMAKIKAVLSLALASL